MSTDNESKLPGPGKHPPVVSWILLAVVGLALIKFGFIPASCSKLFPIINQQFKDVCDECGGDGKTELTCPTCRGRGYWAGAKCSTCGSDGRIEKDCPFCLGKGKKPNP